MFKTTSRRLLATLAGVGTALLLTACGGETVASPPSSSAKPTTTTAELTRLSPRYASRLETARTTPCNGTDMFAMTCGNWMIRASHLANEVAADADRLGSTYGKVSLESRDWATAADKWVSTCMPSEPASPTRIACLKVINPAMTGAESVLAAIYDVESP